MAKTFYEEAKITLVEKYKTLVNQCYSVIDREIDDDLSDDKLHNVLKAKRMAAEDARYYAKEIESLENEMNGIEPVEDKPTNAFKKYTKK